MDPYKDLIMSWLEADKKAPPKQRHTAKRIHDRLVEEYGFTGGESTVMLCLRDKLNMPRLSRRVTVTVFRQESCLEALRNPNWSLSNMSMSL